MSIAEKIAATRDLLVELEQSLAAIRDTTPPAAHAAIDDFRKRAIALAKILNWVGSKIT